MTFCHECGKPVVPPFAKFCRNCGASQWEESQLPITPAITLFPESAPEPLPTPWNTSPLPQSRHSLPPSPQGASEPDFPKICRTCNSPVNAGEKYCGICGSPTSEHDLTVQPGAEIPTSAPAGVCTSCGSPLFKTGKFCGICGVSIDRNPPPHSRPYQPQQPDTIRVCRSCGSPLSGTELFCGICGIPITSTSPGVSASQHYNGKTCSNCGKPIRATTKFCGACGMVVGLK